MNSTLSVIVKTSLQDNSTEEHVAQSNNTKKFSAEVDINQFKFGPDTNRTILIYIYNFTTPLTIKVIHILYESYNINHIQCYRLKIARGWIIFRWPSLNMLLWAYGMPYWSFSFFFAVAFCCLHLLPSLSGKLVHFAMSFPL